MGANEIPQGDTLQNEQPSVGRVFSAGSSSGASLSGVIYNLNIAHMNIRSLRSKAEELEAFISDVIPDVNLFCLTEHWLHHSETDFRFLSDFYIADCFSRSVTVGVAHLS